MTLRDQSSERHDLSTDLDAAQERLKEQAARDRRRDREIQTLDITPPIVIFRFTGSEIVKDADACADEVVEELERRARTTRRGGE
jgi:very-short-patch-repair endonuclease